MTDIPDFDRIPESTSTAKVYRLNNFQNARTFFNPDIPEGDRETLEKKSLAILRDPPETTKKSGRSVVGSFKSALGSRVVHVGGAGFLSAPIIPALAPLVSGSWVLAGVGAVLLIVSESVKDYRSPQSFMIFADQAGKSYVRTEWLDERLHTPLLSADADVHMVMGSLVYKNDRIDKARIETSFPKIVWEIAVTLFEISSARKEIEGVPGTGPQVASLNKVEKLILQRIAALKSCAAMVKKADEQYLRLLSIEKMEKSDVNARIADLLARTAIHDMEMAEINAMSDQMRAVVAAYTEAIDMTLDSVNAALELTE